MDDQKCPHCGSAITDEQETCPGCSAEIVRGLKTVESVTVTVVLFVLILFLSVAMTRDISLSLVVALFISLVGLVFVTADNRNKLRFGKRRRFNSSSTA